MTALNNKEHKKIARQRRRINILSTGLMIEGLIILTLAILADYLASQLKMTTSVGFGPVQYFIGSYGIAKMLWGWRIR